MISYNITLHALSTFFENPKFKTAPNTPYSPKHKPNTQTSLYYLYGTETPKPNHTYMTTELVALVNTNIFTKEKTEYKHQVTGEIHFTQHMEDHMHKFITLTKIPAPHGPERKYSHL